MEQEHKENVEINHSVYRKPKKKDEISYFTNEDEEDDSWKEAVIIINIRI